MINLNKFTINPENELVLSDKILWGNKKRE